MRAVIFKIADRAYALDINQVREVTRLKKITPVPDAAGFVEGVISLRGKVATLINLRSKLGFEKIPLNRSMRIIVTQIEGRIIGMIADSVTEVVDIQKENVTEPDKALSEAQYLTGIAKIGNQIILVANVEKLLSGEDKASIDSVRAKVEVRRKTDTNHESRTTNDEK